MKGLNIDKIAQKELDRRDTVTRRRIVDGIMGLLKEPPEGDIKPLKGALQGLNRLRVGNWRITYENTEEAINVYEIAPRGGAYKKGV
ncbi:MAG: type II toxin-antitoxin system RelE/ParE family toxin [Oscillospiraceae bacterium]|jgi:mRNA interferase RelE/StbE|nr:type II toxin-antitoxin system RelE/ParE family toxin [Oscillospiraceae bacterium]